VKLFVVLSLMLVNCIIENLAHAAKVAGVRTQRLMLANSLFNLAILLAGVAMGIQSPLLNNLVDNAVLRDATGTVLEYCRLIIYTRAIGYALGMVLIPWFANIMEVGVHAMERNGGLMFDALLEYAAPRTVGKLLEQFRVMRLSNVVAAAREPYPRRVFGVAMIVAAFYLAIDMAALYASALVPTMPRTAIALSTALRGIGTVLFVLFVDPFSSMIIDRAAARELPESAANSIVVWLSGGKTLGTLGAQVLLLPFTNIIVQVLA